MAISAFALIGSILERIDDVEICVFLKFGVMLISNHSFVISNLGQETCFSTLIRQAPVRFRNQLNFGSRPVLF